MAVMPVVYSAGGFAPPADKPDLIIPPFSAATARNDIGDRGLDAHTPNPASGGAANDALPADFGASLIASARPPTYMWPSILPGASAK